MAWITIFWVFTATITTEKVQEVFGAKGGIAELMGRSTVGLEAVTRDRASGLLTVGAGKERSMGAHLGSSEKESESCCLERICSSLETSTSPFSLLTLLCVFLNFLTLLISARAFWVNSSAGDKGVVLG